MRSKAWAKRGWSSIREAADKFNLFVVSEVMDPSQIQMMGTYVDIFQVGARNMQNYFLLRALGEVQKPVLLKRGMSATMEEWLLSAEYILNGGNYNVVLCERGIRTFETATRNTLDIAAIPVIQKLSHLPIFADPSHGTGRRDKVPPMARAAVAAGADGLLIEVHNDPDHALSDGAQSLYPGEFRATHGRASHHCARRRPPPGLSPMTDLLGFGAARNEKLKYFPSSRAPRLCTNISISSLPVNCKLSTVNLVFQWPHT